MRQSLPNGDIESDKLPDRNSQEASWRLSAFIVAPLALLILAPIVFAQSITQTKHNLSSSGPGTIKASTESRICVFCHAPHKSAGKAPLWNREDSRAVYTTYTSPTLVSVLGQPTGDSRLCLSCHDGTIALGAIASEPTEIAFQGGVVFLPADHSMLGDNLADDHPISFVYDNALANAKPELKFPAEIPATLPLDHQGRMQCSTCHDAHQDDFGTFLREDPKFSLLCISCHTKSGWTGSVHESSTKTWNGVGIDPWPHATGVTVAENACQNCHQPHEAGQPVHLLGYTQEENDCLVCHDGNIGSDISSSINMISNHPVTMTTGVHQMGENTQTMARHVECVDCHNPHAASATDPPAPNIPGALKDVTGIDINGNPVDPAASSYEVCFKCHGDNHGTSTVVTRDIQSLNTRLDFSPTAVSFHPVTTIGKNPNVPSLIAPMTENSIIACTDCHSSPPGNPAGPHGSTFSPLLKANYSTLDNTVESSFAYELCYSCHSRSSILGNDSFKEHKKHIQGEDAPCATCHDSHGIPSGLGNATQNSHLINFNTSIAFPDPKTGRFEFEDLGNGKGRCYVLCHGKKHSPKSY